MFQACKIQPRHEAYPHTWHWGREFTSFPEGQLILRSWVGTSAIGQPHTGCPCYEVNPRHTAEPQGHHQHYLALERERQELDAELSRMERQETLSKPAEELYQQLFQRYEQILEEQKALRNGARATKPAAA